MKIPGLDIDSHAAIRLIDALEADGWSPKFRRDFVRIGPKCLFERLRNLLIDLDDANKKLCVDDYHKSVQSRDAVVLVERMVPSQIWAPFGKEVADFDSQLLLRWISGPTRFNTATLDKATFWWYFDGLPKGVVGFPFVEHFTSWLAAESR